MKEIEWGKVVGGLFLWQGVVVITSVVMVAGVAMAVGSKLPPQIPLFFSRPWGEEQLGAPWELVWLLGVEIVILMVSWMVKKSKIERIMAAFVNGSGLLGEIIVVLGIIRTVLAVT